jgi:serpin B
MKRFITAALALIVAITATPARRSAPQTPMNRSTNASPLVGGNNQFALDLYAKLSTDNQDNLFFSPYSITTALAMIYAGARGETAEQMQRTLHLTQDQAQTSAAFASLLAATKSKDAGSSGYRLDVANALWGQRGYQFLPEYLKLARTSFDAHLAEVDFSGDVEGARRTINAWVERQTQGKIKDLFKPGMLKPLTRLALTNAIYFKGEWTRKFDEAATRNEPFKVSARQTVTAPLMNQSGRFSYMEDAEMQVISLPYGKRQTAQGDGELSMLVILPRSIDGLARLERELNVGKLSGIVESLRPQQVAVTLPRFKATSEFTLNTELAEMGMPLAFSPNADFSGMNGRRDLYLSIVVHKAFVDVNEEGTEAAAATGGAVVLRAMRSNIFRADHPFIYIIRDNRTGSILFMGRLMNPTAA